MLRANSHSYYTRKCCVYYENLREKVQQKKTDQTKRNEIKAQKQRSVQNMNFMSMSCWLLDIDLLSLGT